jgi:hyperosmotically inducible periplasmic protein
MFTRNVFGAGVAACFLLTGAAHAADDQPQRTLDRPTLDRPATNQRAAETPSDITLLTKVKTALTRDDQTKARQINVEVNEGNVQLLGTVDTAEQKAAAERIAKSVDGVRNVSNNLSVSAQDRGAGQVMSDGMIATKVKAALIADSRTKAHQIEVETRQGEVQLGGFVDSAAAKSAATEVARSVDGVRAVKNDLEVKN